MSTNGSTNGSQTFQQEIRDRAAEQLPAWGIPHLLAIRQMRDMQADARQRLADSHRVRMKNLGFEDCVGADEKVDDVGDITVKGDETNYHFHNEPPTKSAPDANGKLVQKLPTPLPVVEKVAGSNWWKPLAIGAISGATCFPLGWLAWGLTHKPQLPDRPTSVEFPDINYKAHSVVKDHQE